MVDLLKVPGSDCNNCLIIFSPLWSGQGSGEKQTFGWWRLFEHLDVCKIFIRDKSNGWYLSSDGATSGVGAVLPLLRNAIAQMGLQEDYNLYCIGPSMGGYAAFLYGSLLGAKSVFATAIENELCLKGSISERHMKQRDVLPVVSECITKETDYHLVVGEYDVFDLYSASCLPEHVNVDVFPNAGHTVPVQLQKSFPMIDGIVKSMICGWGMKYKKSVFNVHDFKNELFVLYQAYLMILSRSERCLSLVESVNCKMGHFPFAKYLLARALYLNGRKNDALLQMNEILKLRDGVPWDYCHFLGILYRDLRDYKMALEWFMKSDAINPGMSGNADQIKFCESKLLV